MTPHRLVNPEGLARPVGYAHAVVAAPGRLVFLGGQVAHDADGVCRGETIQEQFARALENVVAALAGAGGGPEHLVSVQIFTTDVASYRAAAGELGEIYRGAVGRHYPAMALLGVSELYDPAALVELVCTAVVPEAI
jgi:enamine deaminase RidA (YjgF/YER057c/UK114 family)